MLPSLNFDPSCDIVFLHVCLCVFRALCMKSIQFSSSSCFLNIKNNADSVFVSSSVVLCIFLFVLNARLLVFFCSSCLLFCCFLNVLLQCMIMPCLRQRGTTRTAPQNQSDSHEHKPHAHIAMCQMEASREDGDETNPSKPEMRPTQKHILSCIGFFPERRLHQHRR